MIQDNEITGNDKGKSGIIPLMRALHRDIFLIGLTFIIAISGILLIYRDSGLLMFEQQIVRQLPKQLNEADLGRELHLRRFRVIENNEARIVFDSGVYEKQTGQAIYNAKDYPAIIRGFIALHKANGGSFIHLIVLIYGILLLFLAVSSFWMYKPGTRRFRRVVSVAGIGAVISVVFLAFA